MRIASGEKGAWLNERREREKRGGRKWRTRMLTSSSSCSWSWPGPSTSCKPCPRAHPGSYAICRSQTSRTCYTSSRPLSGCRWPAKNGERESRSVSQETNRGGGCRPCAFAREEWEEPGCAHLFAVARIAEPRCVLDALRFYPSAHSVHALLARGADAVSGRLFPPALHAEPRAVR